MLVHTPAPHSALDMLNLAELFNKTRSDIYNIRGGETLGEGWEWCQWPDHLSQHHQRL